jgi:hypothetical protein
MPSSRTDNSIFNRVIKHVKRRDVDPLSPLIDEYIRIRDTDKALGRYEGHPITMVPRRRPLGRISPSSLCGCARATVMKFAGLRGEYQIDTEQQLLFEDGNWRHHKWQFLFYDMEAVLGNHRFRVISIEEDISIPEMYIAGSLDVLVAIRMKINGKLVWRRYVIDIKGINERGFGHVYGKSEAKHEHQRQVLGYMTGRKVKRGLVLYDDKNTQRIAVFPVTYASEHWQQVVEWTNSVISALRNEKLPDRHIECTRNSFMYTNCPYNKLCWSQNYSHDSLRKMVYKDWTDIDSVWNLGNALASGTHHNSEASE